jgi:hypothetical protein
MSAEGQWWEPRPCHASAAWCESEEGEIPAMECEMRWLGKLTEEHSRERINGRGAITSQYLS